jgi:NadR type nicotinamide-nucleotide adenylyltransferase
MKAPVQRIAIFGPESTGKTTLAQRLAVHFGEPWAPEYVRGFWEEHAGRITAPDLDAIARGQMAGEDEAAARARWVLFCDTELLTNVIWADLLFPGQCPDWVRTEADQRCRNYAMYLFCDTDQPFVPDPQRCFPTEPGRAMCRRLWRETLATRGLPCVEIRGDWPQRTAAAIEAVTGILAPR